MLYTVVGGVVVVAAAVVVVVVVVVVMAGKKRTSGQGALHVVGRPVGWPVAKARECNACCCK